MNEIYWEMWAHISSSNKINWTHRNGLCYCTVCHTRGYYMKLCSEAWGKKTVWACWTKDVLQILLVAGEKLSRESRQFLSFCHLVCGRIKAILKYSLGKFTQVLKHFDRQFNWSHFQTETVILAGHQCTRTTTFPHVAKHET